MDFDLSDEQRLLRESALRFGAQHYEFSAWRARAAARQVFSRSSWSRMAELGWLGLNVPAEDGGIGATPVETMVLMEAFGRFLMLEPYVSTCVIAPVLLQHAAAPVRRALMSDIAEGRAVVSLADAEPGGGFNPQVVATRAEAIAGGGYRLIGAKSHALDGGVADWYVIPARTAGGPCDEAGISLFLVSADAVGLRVRAARAMDHRVNASLRLDNVEVASAALLGPLNAGYPILREAIDLGVAARLGEALGAMEAANEATVEYLKTRRQFGQPIGAFQALQHRAVDMTIACEEARSMTYLATLSLGRPEPERSRALAAAKARVSQTSLFVGRQAVQLHGGVGFSDELMIGHYLKRLIMIDMAFGNADHQRTKLAKLTRAAEAVSAAASGIQELGPVSDHQAQGLAAAPA